MENYHIAVVDVGKTNKKILVFDPDLKIIDERFRKFEEFTKDGIIHDDVDGLKKWMLDTLKELSSQYNIRVISVSAHGATFVTVDEFDQIALPEISYTTDPGEKFHVDFFKKCGDRIELQKSTGTPDFNALLNIGKGIYFVQKKFPEAFKKVKYILHYPQYFGFMLTGNAAADPTYTGNHSYLWNYHKNDWSSVTDSLGIRQLLPKSFLKPWEVLGKIKPAVAEYTGLKNDTLVTVGIHDSNSSMLPYLVSQEKDFVLNSTGTWCVIMHEKEKVAFAEDELGKVVFYNLSAFSKPIKTAIFLGGMEYEYYTNILKKINGNLPAPGFDLQLYQKIISDKKLFILPSVAKGIGQFPDSSPRIVEGDKVFSLEDIENGKSIPGFFREFDLACAVLNLSLAVQTKVALDRADMIDGLPLFTEGGFSRNTGYNALVAAFYPKSTVSLTNLKEATAFGAAMLGKSAAEGMPLRDMGDKIHIEKIPVDHPALTGLSLYYQKFMNLL